MVLMCNVKNIIKDISPPHHINPCYQILSIVKYGINRATLVGV